MKYLVTILVLAAIAACSSKQVVQVDGTKTENEVHAYLKKEKTSFTQCANVSKGKGDVLLQFVVAKSGRVSSVSVLENSTASLDLPECLTLKLNKLKTSTKPAGDVVLKHRFHFG